LASGGGGRDDVIGGVGPGHQGAVAVLADVHKLQGGRRRVDGNGGSGHLAREGYKATKEEQAS